MRSERGRCLPRLRILNKVLTFETEEYWLCVPCRHRMCRGWRLKVTSLCGVCGHQACEECFANGGMVMSQMMGPHAALVGRRKIPDD